MNHPGNQFGPSADETYSDDETTRRAMLRIAAPFPATVRGVDAATKRFEQQTVLDGLSACGIYLRLARPISHGTRLFIVVWLTADPLTQATAPRVALHGQVQDMQPAPGGTYLFDVKFIRHRLLYHINRTLHASTTP